MKKTRKQPLDKNIFVYLKACLGGALCESSLDWCKQALSFAPHPAALYYSILRYLSESQRIKFIRAQELHQQGGARNEFVNVVLRHDLDGKPEKLSLFTAAEEKTGVLSSIYVRMDGETYSPGPLKSMMNELKNKGFEIGLHSLAYCAENWREALLAELGQFYDVFGFPAESVNTHGFSSERGIIEKRAHFIRTVSETPFTPQFILTEHNYSTLYHYAIGDANFAMGKKLSYITKDVLNLPELPPRSCARIITHTDYWE